jgi:hypothetical protein
MLGDTLAWTTLALHMSLYDTPPRILHRDTQCLLVNHLLVNGASLGQHSSSGTRPLLVVLPLLVDLSLSIGLLVVVCVSRRRILLVDAPSRCDTHSYVVRVAPSSLHIKRQEKYLQYCT